MSGLVHHGRSLGRPPWTPPRTRPRPPRAQPRPLSSGFCRAYFLLFFAEKILHEDPKNTTHAHNASCVSHSLSNTNRGNVILNREFGGGRCRLCTEAGIGSSGYDQWRRKRHPHRGPRGRTHARRHAATRRTRRGGHRARRTGPRRPPGRAGAGARDGRRHRPPVGVPAPGAVEGREGIARRDAGGRVGRSLRDGGRGAPSRGGTATGRCPPTTSAGAGVERVCVCARADRADECAEGGASRRLATSFSLARDSDSRSFATDGSFARESGQGERGGAFPARDRTASESRCAGPFSECGRMSVETRRGLSVQGGDVGDCDSVP